MKRLAFAVSIVSAVALALAGLYQMPEERLSIRFMHPRSSQMIAKIERGQAVVPANFEVLEVDHTASIPDDRLLVSRRARLTEEDITSVELVTSPGNSNIYLQLSPEAINELYDLVENYPDRKLVIVTESGEAMPIQRSGRGDGRLAIHLDPAAKKAEVQELAADLRNDI